MRATTKVLDLFRNAGWDDAALTQQGYMAEGQPTDAALNALKEQGWTDEVLKQHGLVEPEQTAQQAPAQESVRPKVSRYIELREQKEELDKQLKENKKPIAEEMSEIESELGGFLQQTGQRNAAFDEGTVFFTDKVHVGAEDYDAFLRFMVEGIINRLAANGFIAQGAKMPELISAAIESDSLGFLTKNLNKESVKQYVESKGTPPPGIKHEVVQEVSVRRPTRK